MGPSTGRASTLAFGGWHGSRHRWRWVYRLASRGALLDEGWEVYALDDLSTGSEANLFHIYRNPNFHLTVESVLAASVVSELVHKADVVFHLAAAVGVRLIVERPGHTLLTNVRGTENVLEYAGASASRS